MITSNATIRALVFPEDGSRPHSTSLIDGGRPGLHNLVNGSYEYIFLDGQRLAMVVNEYYKSRGDLSPNPYATRFPDRFCPGLAKTTIISGPAVVIGLDPETGKPTDVPDDLPEPI